MIGGGHYVSEPNSQHDVGAPVVRPYIPFKPLGLVNFFDNHPVDFLVDVGHGDEEYCQDVGEAEVEDDCFN